MDQTMITIVTIIKELAEEFKTQFTCLGENTEKYSSNRKRSLKN